MFGYNEKVLLISTGSYYEEGDTPTVHTQEIDSCTQLMKLLVNDLANNVDAMKVLLENKYFVDALDRAGFRDVAKIQDIEAKISAGKRFYTYQTNGGYGGSLVEVDLTNLVGYQAEHLASEKVLILQSIDKSQMAKINSGAYKKMLGAKKRIEAAAKARTAKAAGRAEKKKQKELENARKLLQEAGVKEV